MGNYLLVRRFRKKSGGFAEELLGIEQAKNVNELKRYAPFMYTKKGAIVAYKTNEKGIVIKKI